MNYWVKKIINLYEIVISLDIVIKLSQNFIKLFKTNVGYINEYFSWKKSSRF